MLDLGIPLVVFYTMCHVLHRYGSKLHIWCLLCLKVSRALASTCLVLHLAISRPSTSELVLLGCFTGPPLPVPLESEEEVQRTGEQPNTPLSYESLEIASHPQRPNSKRQHPFFLVLQALKFKKLFPVSDPRTRYLSSRIYT